MPLPKKALILPSNSDSMAERVAKKRIRNLRFIGIAEGISFLLLLGIAMPLKYFAGIPEAVKITGWAHGVLFIAYVYALVIVHSTQQWSILKTGLAFIASLVPFGTFVLDRNLKKEEESLATT